MFGFPPMKTFSLSVRLVELRRLQGWCSSWTLQRCNTAFQTPNTPWFSQNHFSWDSSKLFLYYLRWVFDKYMRKREVSQWEDTSVWAAVQLWQRIHRYFCFGESSSSVVLHSVVSQSIFCVVLFQLLLIIAGGVFLNVNFPKITRNHPAGCHGPFPLPCLHLVWRAVKLETSFVHSSPCPALVFILL